MGNAHERFDRQGIKPRGGVCRWRSQRDARCHRRGTASAQCAARIGQLRSMMSSFEGFWLRTKETAQGLRKLRALALTLFGAAPMPDVAGRGCAPTLAAIVNKRPLAVSLGLGAIRQGPRSTWCSGKSSGQNSALENVIDWLKSAIHISA